MERIFWCKVSAPACDFLCLLHFPILTSPGNSGISSWLLNPGPEGLPPWWGWGTSWCSSGPRGSNVNSQGDGTSMNFQRSFNPGVVMPIWWLSSRTVTHWLKCQAPPHAFIPLLLCSCDCDSWSTVRMTAVGVGGIFCMWQNADKSHLVCTIDDRLHSHLFYCAHLCWYCCA
jgi:hypothetical protein